MSTDAFFFFHMDPENRMGNTSSAPTPAQRAQRAHQPTASTSSSSVVSSHARRQFLVEYSPKPARSIQTQVHAPVPFQAIHRWLDTHRSASYEPLEHSSFSDDEDEEESEEEQEFEDDEASSESDSEDDQIYMAPRRQHSSQSISITAPLPAAASAAAAPISSSVPRRAWPLSAARPALPVVDRAEATAFTTLVLQDKSHWSDDEEDIIEDEDDEDEDEWIGEDDEGLPELDADSGAPASTSTRSLPIPIFAPPRTRSNPRLTKAGVVDHSDEEAECVEDLDALWDSSYQAPHRRKTSRKMIQDGQSFWTPWISDYMVAAQNQ